MKKLILLAITICFSNYLFAQTTLQTVTNAGSTTTKDITVNTVESTGGFARFYLNGTPNTFVGADHSAFGQGGTDAVFYVYGGNKFHIATGNTRRLTIDGIGNVGIGTTTPSAKLHLFNSYDAVNTVGLKMFYQGSWGNAAYASN
ncbi:MAG: hypothetical protein JWQ25_543, partial [Daejeonella sp.]|nr:hypothetical protein [Daejeonella sp.]